MAPSGDITTYYIGLLAIQFTLIAIIVAVYMGIVQVYKDQVPHRDRNLLFKKRRNLLFWIMLFTLILVVNALAVHEVTFGTIIQGVDGSTTVQVEGWFVNHWIALTGPLILIILAMTLILFLIDSIDNFSAGKYLKLITKDESRGYGDLVAYCRYYANRTSHEVETIGLPCLQKKLLQMIKNKKYIWIGDITDDLKSPLNASTLKVQKRYIDLLIAIANRYGLRVRRGQPIALEPITDIYKFVKGKAVDEEIKIYAVHKISEFIYKLYEKGYKEEKKRTVLLECHAGISLFAVACIAEDYYNQVELQLMSTIEDDNEVGRSSFTSILADYFSNLNFGYGSGNQEYVTDKTLHLLHQYFEALEASGEALVNAMTRSPKIHRIKGMASSSYENTCGRLYSTFSMYNERAIKTENRGMLEYSVRRMLRAFGQIMDDETFGECRLELASDFIQVAIMVLSRPTILKKPKPIVSFDVMPELTEAISQYDDKTALRKRLSSIQHGLIDYDRYGEEVYRWLAKVGIRDSN